MTVVLDDTQSMRLVSFIENKLQELGFRRNPVAMLDRSQPYSSASMTYTFTALGGAGSPVSGQTDNQDTVGFVVFYQATNNSWNALYELGRLKDQISDALLNGWDDVNVPTAFELSIVNGVYELHMQWMFGYERVFEEE